LTQRSLQPIDVREKIAAPPIALVRRAGLALTPAAEFLVDLLRRVAEGRRLTAPARAQT
jgi:LysR family transcriptional regulator of abg operon